MTTGLQTVIYPVNDIDRAKQFYGKLFGVAPYVDEAYYVAFNVGGQDVGLDPNGHRLGMTGGLCYWVVGDINASLAILLDAGGETKQAVKDVGGGRLIASVMDTNGNVIGLVQSP